MATVTILHSRSEPSEMVSLEQIYRQADLLMFFLVWGLFVISAGVGWYYDHLTTALIVGGMLAFS